MKKLLKTLFLYLWKDNRVYLSLVEQVLRDFLDEFFYFSPKTFLFFDFLGDTYQNVDILISNKQDNNGNNTIN